MFAWCVACSRNYCGVLPCKGFSGCAVSMFTVWKTTGGPSSASWVTEHAVLKLRTANEIVTYKTYNYKRKHPKVNARIWRKLKHPDIVLLWTSPTRRDIGTTPSVSTSYRVTDASTVIFTRVSFILIILFLQLNVLFICIHLKKICSFKTAI